MKTPFRYDYVGSFLRPKALREARIKYESKEILDFYNAGAIFVYKDKKVSVTDNIKDNFVIINKDYNLIN